MDCDKQDGIAWAGVECGGDPDIICKCSISDGFINMGPPPSFRKQSLLTLYAGIVGVALFLGVDLYWWCTSSAAGLFTVFAIAPAMLIILSLIKRNDLTELRYDITRHELAGRRITKPEWESVVPIEPQRIQLDADRIILCLLSEETPARVVLMVCRKRRGREDLARELAEVLHVELERL